MNNKLLKIFGLNFHKIELHSSNNDQHLFGMSVKFHPGALAKQDQLLLIQKVLRVARNWCSNEMEDWLAKKTLDLRASINVPETYKDVDFVIVATPTDYDPETKCFNTSSVESVIRDVIAVDPTAWIIIKSTIPIGFVRRIRAETGYDDIAFSPEFLREGNALHDNLHLPVLWWVHNVTLKSFC